MRNDYELIKSKKKSALSTEVVNFISMNTTSYVQ